MTLTIRCQAQGSCATSPGLSVFLLPNQWDKHQLSGCRELNRRHKFLSLPSTLTLPVAPGPMDPAPPSGLFGKQTNTCFTYTNDSRGVSEQGSLAVHCVLLSLCICWPCWLMKTTFNNSLISICLAYCRLKLGFSNVCTAGGIETSKHQRQIFQSCLSWEYELYWVSCPTE